MNRRNKTLIVLALLGAVTLVAIVTRAWWLVLAVAIGMVTASLSRPVARYYRRRGVAGRRTVIAAGMLFCLGIMALYVWEMGLPALRSGAATGITGWLFGIVWTILMALPAALLVMLVRAWRHAGDASVPREA